jgi:cytochrome P450
MNTHATSRFENVINSPAFVADPYEVFCEMRTDDPVLWSDGIGGWILTRYDDIVVSFKETSSFSNEGRLAQSVEHLTGASRERLAKFEAHYRTKGLLHSDPPDHTRLRSLVTKAFTPRVIETLKPRIKEIVTDLLKEASARGDIDIVRDLAIPLPATVIAEMLGAPTADRHRFRKWADDLLAFQGINKPPEAVLLQAQESLIEMRDYLMVQIEEKRTNPKDDLLTKLVQAESEGDRLSVAELINTCVTLLVAGHETTTSLLGSSVFTLLTHPEALAKIRADWDLLPQAIEEVLRYESPVSRQPRLMKRDFELDGKLLKKGEIVFQMLNAANRDPAHFENPETFDIFRKNNRHLAFGQGIHFCVGATLARAEANIALKTLFEMFPNIALVDPNPDWDVEKRNSRMLRKLPVSV